MFALWEVSSLAFLDRLVTSLEWFVNKSLAVSHWVLFFISAAVIERLCVGGEGTSWKLNYMCSVKSFPAIVFL